MVLMVFLVRVELTDPRAGCGDHFGGVSSAEFDPGAIAHPVLGAFEEFEQFSERLIRDEIWPHRGPALDGDPVDPSMVAIPAGISQVMLHVADDGVVPVEEIEGPVRADLYI